MRRLLLTVLLLLTGCHVWDNPPKEDGADYRDNEGIRDGEFPYYMPISEDHEGKEFIVKAGPKYENPGNLRPSNRHSGMQ